MPIIFFLAPKRKDKNNPLVRATSSLFTTGLPGAARRASHVTPPRRTSAWCGENIGQRIGLVDQGAGACACLRGSQAGSWGTRVRGATRWRSAGRAPQRWARTTAQSLSCGRVVAMSVRDRRDFATVVVRRARPDSGANAGPCAMLRRSRSLLG